MTKIPLPHCMPGSGNSLGVLLYAGLQVGDAKGGSHNGVQTLRVVCVHPVARVVQEIDAVTHPGYQVLVLQPTSFYQ